MTRTTLPIPQTPESKRKSARRSPARREWTEEEYLDLSTNRLVEYSDGRLEVLPMPTQAHQLIVRFLLRLLDAFVEERGLGVVLFAGLRVRLWPRKYREPDVVFMRVDHADR